MRIIYELKKFAGTVNQEEAMSIFEQFIKCENVVDSMNYMLFYENDKYPVISFAYTRSSGPGTPSCIPPYIKTKEFVSACFEAWLNKSMKDYHAGLIADVSNHPAFYVEADHADKSGIFFYAKLCVI